MKVLLKEDVVNLGRIGDMVEVKPGYARNYLIPQGLAMLATSGAQKQADNLKRTAEKRRARELSDAQAFANVLKSLTLKFERKVGDKGRLYGSVTNADVADRIEQVLEMEGEELDKRKVLVQEPIRRLGSYEIEIRVHPDVAAFVQVEVVGDEGETAADFMEEEPVAAEVDAEGPQPTAEY